MTNEIKTDDEIDAEFRKLADAFIDLANRECDNNHPENVGLALLFAASRFNAFVVSLHAPDAGKFEEDKARARQYFVEEYGRMLDENLDDYQKVYDKDLKYAHLMQNRQA